jgi:hypothetical protein
LTRYARNYNILEILQKYAALPGSESTPSEDTVDKVTPILNPKKKKYIVN